MNNKILFYIGVGVVVMGLIWFSGMNQAEKGEIYSRGILTTNESQFNFGEIAMTNGLVRHTFNLTNTGEEILEIGKVYTSCMCTEAYVANKGPFGMPGHGGLSRAGVTVLPGEEVAVEAVFDPAAHGPAGVGLADRVIYLETNSQISPEVVLGFRAYVAK